MTPYGATRQENREVSACALDRRIQAIHSPPWEDISRGLGDVRSREPAAMPKQKRQRRIARLWPSRLHCESQIFIIIFIQ